MAEIFGLVASGVSIGAFTGQIASNIVKLKSYLDQVKDVPEDFAHLIDEIDDVYFLLSNIEADQHRNSHATMLLDNNSVSRCLDHCRRGAERLQHVVDNIALEFECLNPIKTRWKFAKIVWKWDRVEKYRAELMSAVRLLTLSHQVYIRSLIRRQPDVITSRISQLLLSESFTRAAVHSAKSPNVDQIQGSYSNLQAGHKPKVRMLSQTHFAWLRWKSYSLLLSRAWNIEIYKAQQGWNFHISTYALVSYNSLVARYTMTGNIEELRRLFSKGDASPFTVCLEIWPEGYTEMRTLLEIGVDCGNFDLCELLIKEGADPDVFVSSMPPIDRFAMNAVRRDAVLSESWQLARLLQSRSEITLHTLDVYRGPTSVFSFLLSHVNTPGQELHIEDRIRVAINQVRNAKENSPDLFLVALGASSIAQASITTQGVGEFGETLLHAAAGALGQLTCSGMKWVNAQRVESFISEWKSIICDLVATGTDLHATCSVGSLGDRLIKCAKADSCITPLILMLAAPFLNSPRVHGSGGNPNKALHIWVSTLFNLGVDLKNYGKAESLRWFNLEDSMRWEYNEYTTSGIREYHSDYYFGRIRLLGFTYDALPEDWRVWQNEPTDEFAGEFWCMLEKKVQVMPGTWVQ